MSSSHSGSPSESLKRTALYPQHCELGARLGPFSGWELPIYYTSILQEHQTVRTAVGLFDVSHLGHLELHGPGTASQLQLLFTQDLVGMKVGTAVYSPMLNPQGWIIDEMILYRLGQERFRLVVNAANGNKVIHWLKAHLSKGVRLDDLRDKYGTLAVQGPRAVELLGKVSSMDFAGVPRYRIVSAMISERQVWVARTGYTGEDGFEMYSSPSFSLEVWETLTKAGRGFGLKPVGLGARDTLRLEARLPLYGHDLDDDTTPFEAGLGWTVALQKEFIGREVLSQQKEEGVKQKWVGFEMLEQGIPRQGCTLWKDRLVGKVTSGTYSPSLKKNIGLGYVILELSGIGTEFFVEIRDKKLRAKVVETPFYKRSHS